MKWRAPIDGQAQRNAVPAFRRLRRLLAAHFDAAAQVAAKQRLLEDALWHIGRVRPGAAANPWAGVGIPSRPPFGPPRRKKWHADFGFHERKSSYVAGT